MSESRTLVNFYQSFLSERLMILVEPVSQFSLQPVQWCQRFPDQSVSQWVLATKQVRNVKFKCNWIAPGITVVTITPLIDFKVIFKFSNT